MDGRNGNIGNRQRSRAVAHDFVELPVIVFICNVICWGRRKVRRIDEGENRI